MGSEAVDNGTKRAEHGDEEAVRQGYEVNVGTVGKKNHHMYRGCDGMSDNQTDNL